MMGSGTASKLQEQGINNPRAVIVVYFTFTQRSRAPWSISLEVQFHEEATKSSMISWAYTTEVHFHGIVHLWLE